MHSYQEEVPIRFLCVSGGAENNNGRCRLHGSPASVLGYRQRAESALSAGMHACLHVPKRLLVLYSQKHVVGDDKARGAVSKFN
jgi:hypothetical protein